VPDFDVNRHILRAFTTIGWATGTTLVKWLRLSGGVRLASSGLRVACGDGAAYTHASSITSPKDPSATAHLPRDVAQSAARPGARPDRHVPGPQRDDALIIERMLALVLFNDQGQLQDFPNGPVTSRRPANGSLPSRPGRRPRSITHSACLLSPLGLDGQHQCSYAERNIWCERDKCAQKLRPRSVRPDGTRSAITVYPVARIEGARWTQYQKRAADSVGDRC
jgi:hypothetical protein